MDLTQDRHLPIFSSEVQRAHEAEVAAQFDDGLTRSNICVINNTENHGTYFTLGLHLLGMDELIFEDDKEVLTKVAKVVTLAVEQDLLPSEMTDVIEDLGLGWHEVEPEEFLYGQGVGYRYWLETKQLENPRFIEVYRYDSPD